MQAASVDRLLKAYSIKRVTISEISQIVMKLTQHTFTVFKLGLLLLYLFCVVAGYHVRNWLRFKRYVGVSVLSSLLGTVSVGVRCREVEKSESSSLSLSLSLSLWHSLRQQFASLTSFVCMFVLCIGCFYFFLRNAYRSFIWLYSA
jgi:hypothetical protein